MTYDRHRLLVWPEWESSGIWHPSGPVEDPGPVAMVEYESVNLPKNIKDDFVAWMEWFNEGNAPWEDDNAFPYEEFDKEGLRLAHELANFMAGKYQVEYQGKVISPLVDLFQSVRQFAFCV